MHSIISCCFDLLSYREGLSSEIADAVAP